MQLLFKSIQKVVGLWNWTPTRRFQSSVSLKSVPSCNWHTREPSVPQTEAGSSSQQFEVYNSLTKRKQPLLCKTNKLVTWYCCGPTVYDESHVGHALCYLRSVTTERSAKS